MPRWRPWRSNVEDRLLGPEARDDEDSFEATLRPRRMSEYLGQVKVKEHLAIFVRAAKERREPLDHVLLFGPSGLGKTTLAHVIAQEMGANLKVTSGPAIEKAGDLAAILTNLEENDVIFVDEIHRLSPTIEEILYPAMEDNSLDLMIGSGPSARSVRIDLKPFTLIGATTRASLLTGPLRGRFGIIEHLDYYCESDLAKIATRSATVLRADLDDAGAMEIARRARGTPRIVNRLLRRVRDFAQVEHAKTINERVALRALDQLEVDALGLDDIDRRLLLLILEKFDGGPVGLSTLAAALGEDRGAIEEIIEPYLIQHGLLDRTPRGRTTTQRAARHLGIRPGGGQRGLFREID